MTKLCKNGHPLEGYNAQPRKGGVMCRICQDKRVRQWGIANRERRNANARRVYAEKRLADIAANGERTLPSLLDRLSSSMTINENGCWVWNGAVLTTHDLAYGVIWANGRSRRTHRVSYELHRGPVPDGLVLDHLCRNTLCINPDHLEPVTNAENIRRGFSPSMQLHRLGTCKKGHPLTPENTYSNMGRGVQCRTCTREKSRDYYLQNRESILAKEKQNRQRSKESC